MAQYRKEECLIRQLPELYPGPGGAIAIIKDGQVRARESWGYINLERHIPFTPRATFRICSITKQFTCALLLDAFPDFSRLDEDVRHFLPQLSAPLPKIAHLAHNQSGLRDYWAMGMVMGALPDTLFSEDDARHIMMTTKTLQFTPGTSYSYCNQNFRLIGDIVARRLDRDYASLMHHHVFSRYGMEHAFIAADTTSLPDGGTGYEGSVATGFIPAKNRILWTGDAGIGATLDDLIAWELYIDRERNHPRGIYQQLSQPQSFTDGTPAPYGFGLRHFTFEGRKATGHGGGLRGWHSFRMHVPEDRLSVVVLFNHMSNAYGAALRLARAAIGLDEAPPRQVVSTSPADVPPTGLFLDDAAGLAAQIFHGPAGRMLHYLHPPETCPEPDEVPEDPFRTRISSEGEATLMHRPGENRSVILRRLHPYAYDGPDDRDVLRGAYYCAENDSWLDITTDGQGLYGAFFGFLGKGPMSPIRRLSDDVFSMPCRRALDHAPPGDWTIEILDARKKKARHPAREIRVGCWLARNLRYRRVNAVFDRGR